MFNVARVAVVLLLAAVFSAAPCSEAQSAKPPQADAGPWWRDAIFYEIYVRSFQDSNGDGVGDLPGVIQRLDYLQQLGVNAIWLTPIFPSPQLDMGYDISDFTAIDPLYGSMDDLDRLVSEAKKRNIRVLLDFVMNHTSDEHPWFKESRSSKDNPKRDWYIWRPGANEKTPPNNWRDRIEHCAWQFDPTTGEYYYHYFAIQQPDLNWRNPQVEEAMMQVARFWLKRGIAGFRLDAVNTLFEDPQLRDEPAREGTNEYGDPAQSQQYQRNLPEVHDVLRKLRSVTGEFPGSPVLVGEIYTGSPAEASTWYGKQHEELQLPMNTSLGFLNKRDAAGFREKLTEITSLSPQDDPLLVFDNHDRPRSIDRYGDGAHDIDIAKIMAAILLSSKGSAILYQGQEIGMRTTPVTRKEDVRDPRGIAGWPKEKGRDGERTPMQWNDSPGAGFTSGHPWLPVPANFGATTVTAETADPSSLLSWYRKLIVLRRENEAFHHAQQRVLQTDPNILAWLRTGSAGETWLVVCNFSTTETTAHLAAALRKESTARLHFQPRLSSQSISPQSQMAVDDIALKPFEVLIGKLQ